MRLFQALLTPIAMLGASLQAQTAISTSPPPQPANASLVLSLQTPQPPSTLATGPELPQTPVPVGPVQTLTLDEVVVRAREQSPRLRGAGAVIDQANAATTTARAYSNPSVEVFGGEQYARPIATPGVPGLLQHYAVYQPVEIPSERRLRVRSAVLAAQASRLNLTGQTLSVVAEAKHAFYNVLRQREEVEHTQETLELVDDLRRRVQVEVNVGEKGRLELTRAEAEVARARFALRSAQLNLANAIAQLRIAIAAPADANLNPAGTLEPRIALPPLQTLREQVLRTHPAIASAQTDIAAAEANLAHERSLRIPQPTLFAEYENQPDLRFWRAGVTVPLPLWDRRAGRIQGAKAGVAQNTAVLDQRRLELISATERAFEAYQLGDAQAQSLEAGELHAAETAVSTAQAAYRFGERGILEVLDAQRVLQAVRDDLLDAQFARQAALVDLEELGALDAPGGTP